MRAKETKAKLDAFKSYLVEGSDSERERVKYAPELIGGSFALTNNYFRAKNHEVDNFSLIFKDGLKYRQHPGVHYRLEPL